MKKMLLLLIVGLFLCGCDGETQETVTESPFIGGSQGLVAEFEPLGIEEAGEYEIYADESFPIQIIFKNKGEQDVNAADLKAKIHGIYLGDFIGIAGTDGELSSTELVEGRIKDVDDEGGETIIDFGSNVKYAPEIPGTFYDANVFVDFTYRYKTYSVVPEVCFKENLRDESVCEVEGSKTVYVSAAPIQVKSVEEKTAGKGIIEVDFNVVNVGSGDVTLPGEEFNDRYGQVRFQIEPATERPNWKCTHGANENFARLTDGEATIRCKLRNPLEEGDLYIKQIGLALEYDYKEQIKDTVRIKKEI